MSAGNTDFNTDVAQGFGIYKNNLETELLDYVSTVNISCGFHAGDPYQIREFLLKCKEKNLTIAAHIGYNDIAGMGYRKMDLTADEIEALVIYQLGALVSFAKSYSLTVDSVRPHGALYRAAAENYDVAKAIVDAIQKVDKWLNYTCADNEIADRLEAETNVLVNREIFVDKIYKPDFTPDWENETFISDEDALNRIRTVLHSSQIKIGNGMFMPVRATTIHFNSKNPNALALIKKANEIVVPTQPCFNKALTSGWV